MEEIIDVVLVLGDGTVDLYNLIYRIKEKENKYGDEKSNRNLLKENQEKENRIITWNVKTKYYVANVQFRLIDLENVQTYEGSTLQSWVCKQKDNIQGVLLACQSTLSDKAQSILQISQSIVKDSCPEVSLCIVCDGNKKETTNENESPIGLFHSNFEVVQLDKDFMKEDILNEEEKNKNLLNETKGIARIIEALQCVMWTSMERVSEEKQDEEEDTTDYPDLLCAFQSLKTNDLSEEDALQDLIEQVTNIRKNAADLSDVDRRKVASDMALKLMQFFDEDENEVESLT